MTPQTLAARLRDFAHDREQFRTDPSGWVDRVSEEFYRETGIIGPGRSVPLEMGGMWTADQRQEAWSAFIRRRSEAYDAALLEAARAVEATACPSCRSRSRNVLEDVELAGRPGTKRPCADPWHDGPAEAGEATGEAPRCSGEPQTGLLTRMGNVVAEVSRLREAVSPPRAPQADDESRCAICGWPLKAMVSEGCVRGNCSMRPFPEYAYAPERAAREYGPFLDMSRFKNARAVPADAPGAQDELYAALEAVTTRLAERFGTDATNNLDRDVLEPAQALLAAHVPSVTATADASDAQDSIEAAFKAGYHCRWHREQGAYCFDPAMSPGDPDGAFAAWQRLRGEAASAPPAGSDQSEPLITEAEIHDYHYARSMALNKLLMWLCDEREKVEPRSERWIALADTTAELHRLIAHWLAEAQPDGAVPPRDQEGAEPSR